MLGIVKKNTGIMLYHRLPEDWKDGDYGYVKCKKAPPLLISAEMGILTDPKTGKETVFATRYLARKEFFSAESEICQKCQRCVKHLKK